MGTVTSTTRFVANHTGPTTPDDPSLVSLSDLSTALSIDSVAVSTATSKAVSQINASNASSAPTSTADSKAVSAGTRASTADSKAVSAATIASGVAQTTFISPLTGGVSRTLTSKLADIVSVKDFGATGDGVTDDWAAFKAAHDALLDGTDAWRGGTIIVPRGRYYLGQTWKITKRVVIQGENAGYQYTNAASLLTFPANTTGIRVYSSQDAPDGNSAAYTRIVNLQVYAVTRAADGHGIHASAVVHLDNVIADNFALDNFHIEASANIGAGNANGWSARDCHSLSAGRDGFHTEGNDVNAGMALNVQCHNSVRWNFYDDSVLGNVYLACLSEGSGIGAFKSEGGGNYYINPYVEGAGGYACEFGVADFVLGNIADNQAPNLVISGGGGSGARAIVNQVDGSGGITSVLVTNGGSGYSGTPTVAIGGHGSGSGATFTAVVNGSGVVTSITITAAGTGYAGDVRVPYVVPDGASGGFRSPRIRVVNRKHGTERQVEAILGDTANAALTFTVQSTGNPSTLDWTWNEARGCFELMPNGGPSAGSMRIAYGDGLGVDAGGRSAPLSIGSISYPFGFWLGRNDSARFVGNAAAMPTSGEYAGGDMVFNILPAVHGTAGSQYVLQGWMRLTYGSNHVLNTDWVEMRTLTGT